MDDLISRRAAIGILYNFAGCIVDTPNGDYHKAYKKYKCDLENLPSAQPEQPEIIRCKDCKHYQFADNRAFGMPVKMCKWFGFEDVDDDDFCSRAERREE